MDAGLGFSRWATEAMLVEEFKRYDYYMQPRIHLIMSEVTITSVTRMIIHFA